MIQSNFRLRYYSVYILLLSGAILVIAAAVHFFFEVDESDDPCENNKSEHNIGKLYNKLCFTLTRISFLNNIFIH